MYTYYFLAAALKGDPDKRRRYTAWGRHLTLFQMLQFVTMLAQVRCPLPVRIGLSKAMRMVLASSQHFACTKCNKACCKSPSLALLSSGAKQHCVGSSCMHCCRAQHHRLFSLCCVQAVYCIVAGKYNAFLARLLAGYMLTLLALFAHFYARKHAADGANGGKRSKRTKAA